MMKTRRVPGGSRLRVLYVTPELAPWAKVGGLGDVSRELPEVLWRAGIDVRVLVPAYPALREAFPAAAQDSPLMMPAPGYPPARLMRIDTPVPAYLVDCPPYFDRPGNAYQSPDGTDWPDNHRRFGLLSWIAALLGSSMNPIAWKPDVIHCQDWPAAAVPAFLRTIQGERAATVLTIHNLAYQGVFPRTVFNELGMPASSKLNGFDHPGGISFLAAGLRHADGLTTVSPTYAREIQSAALGGGLEALLRRRARNLTGILNGIDADAWRPVRNPHLAHGYDAARLEHKSATKRLVQRSLGLPERDDLPLFGVVARLVWQKGLDFIVDAAARIVGIPAQIAVLGQGERGIEEALVALAARHPRDIAVRIGYEEPLAHRLVAGADVFLMPSRYEPCGLTPMHAACCGTPVVARRTGGLADSVIDATEAALGAGIATGFLFDEATPEALLVALRRALALYERPGEWQRLQRAAMARDFGWSAAVPAYAAVYHRAIRAQARPRAEDARPQPQTVAVARRARLARGQSGLADEASGRGAPRASRPESR